MIAVVDAGPLYAVTDTDDQDHKRSRAVLERSDLQLVIPALVVAEVTYIVGRRLGPDAEARFLRGLAGFDIEGPAPEDWPRIADLVQRYRSFPLGGTDASVVTLAERLGATVLITLDHRHFAAIKPRHRAAFELLPE
jgi:predicted nucleic acid-binding protein